MNPAFADLSREYQAALQDFLQGAGEDALRQGYEIGRRAMTAGLGLLDMATMQEEALSAVLRALPSGVPEDVAEAARRAFAFFCEGLAPYEMGLLGFREANATLRQLNETLEGKNTDLGQARDEAERRADALARAQSQLVQAEKLAALGQLVAGVAHEINNPLSFVSNNVAVMQRDMNHLCELLRTYQEADPAVQAGRPELYQRIRELSERIDLGYTLDNLGRLLLRSRDGLRRIQQIVLDLRNFARLDESDLHEVDVNAGVESTLNIIGASARERQVELHKDLGELPRISCYPAKINQVVLNLVVNAIDACSPGGRVTVRTRKAQDAGSAAGVEIHVLDTGSGILPAHRDKIFDPFFTTKPPGKGTGLGLSISHGIVADHGGRIQVDSVPGQGTHFIVFLPTAPPGRKQAPVDNPHGRGL